MVEPWQWGIASVCVFLCASLAVGAGIGGGALFVAVYMIILGMDAHSAVPLSKATIFGLAIAAYSVNAWKRHPHSNNRPLIDYNTALMLEPMTLLGAIAGVLLNVLLPNWLVLMPLCVLLLVVSYRTIRKGLRLRKREQGTTHHVLLNERIKQSNDDEEEAQDGGPGFGNNGSNSNSDDEGDGGEDNGEDDRQGRGKQEQAAVNETSGIQNGRGGIDGNGGDDDEYRGGHAMETLEMSDSAVELSRIQAKEARTVPWEKLVLLTLVWIGYTIITTLLYEAHELLRPCSPGWIVLLFCAVPYVVVITFFAGRMMKRDTQRKRRCNYPFLPGDVMWEDSNLNKFPALAFFAGVAAAMMGIGGGMIKSPIMLAMGLPPQVVTTTSSFMIIFTSSATTLQYLILGKIDPQDLAIVMSMGFAGALLGQRVVNYIVAKYKKQSFLIFLLGGLTIVSGIVIIATSLATESFDKVELNTADICGAGSTADPNSTTAIVSTATLTTSSSQHEPPR